MGTKDILKLAFLLILITSCTKENIEDIGDEPISMDKDLDADPETLLVELTEHTREDQMGAFAENAMAVFNGKVWSVGGFNAYSGGNPSSDVWQSDNGINWISVTSDQFPERKAHTLTVYDNALWLIGGVDATNTFLGDVWHSIDGENWTLITSTPAFLSAAYHDVIVFNNQLYLIKDGTSGVEVWSSADGLTWNSQVSGAFPSRENFDALVFNNEVYVLGGQNTAGPLNEIWKSADGITWSEVATTTVFNPRDSHTATVYNNKVWVAGGFGTTAPEGNLWYSEDMIDWYEYTPIASDIGLYDHTALRYEDEIWLFGGREGRSGGSFAMTGKIRSLKETTP